MVFSVYVLRPKLYSRLSLCDWNSDCLHPGAGIISGFKIDHNTGNLVPIHGLPVSSGGANPGRAVLLTGGRFLYVLNQGVNRRRRPLQRTDVCSNANITQFSIGGNGYLAPQGTYYTQGNNPFRMVADASGSHLFALDQSPGRYGVLTGLGSGSDFLRRHYGLFDRRDHRPFELVVNSQVTSATGSPLPYFPVPANPIDFTLSSNYFITLSGTPTTGDSVFPYAYNVSNGQLTVNQNSSQPLE